ncbi:MAG TPA: MFS transporter [Chitinophagaceae bacterium]
MLSQFAGTSLWFVGNALLPELKELLQLDQYAVSLVTSAVMLGFVAGTLVFAFFSLADRFSPVKIFFISSLLGAFSNIALAWWATDIGSLFTLRFLTGFCIAGIYPVGMKIAADWYEKGLGKALGYLLGALIVGTAFPHLLKNREFHLPWKSVLYWTSIFATVGGFLMLLLVGDGPHRKKSGKFQWNAIPEIFRSKKWKQASFGYFGHMWELYAFWGFTPILIELYNKQHAASLNTPLLSFFVIASGMISSIAGGYLSQKWGNARVAFMALLISGSCCLLSPLFFYLPPPFFILLLLIWGLTVSPDSPQFSTLVANYSPPHLKATALTIYNSIGFSITAISLVVLDRIINWINPGYEHFAFMILGLGAIAGLPPILRLMKTSQQ